MSIAAVRSAATSTSGLLAIAAAISVLAIAYSFKALGPGEYGFLDYGINGICIEAGDDTTFLEFAGASNPTWYPPQYSSPISGGGITPLLHYPPWVEKDTALWWRFRQDARPQGYIPATGTSGQCFRIVCPPGTIDTVWTTKPENLSYDSIRNDTLWHVSNRDLPWAYQVTTIPEPGGPGQVVLASHTGRFPLGTCG